MKFSKQKGEKQLVHSPNESNWALSCFVVIEEKGCEGGTMRLAPYQSCCLASPDNVLIDRNSRVSKSSCV